MLFLLIITFTIFLEFYISWSLQTIPDGGNGYLWDTLKADDTFILSIAQFALSHLVLQALIISYSLYLGYRLSVSLKNKVNYWVLASVIYLLIKLFLYYRNSLLYPKSSFALHLPDFLQSDLAYNAVTILFLSLLFALPALLVVTSTYKKCFQNHRLPAIAAFSFLFIGLGLFQTLGQTTQSNPKQKNIIFIGIDSVNWQQIESNIQLLPTFSELISTGYTWNNAVTPLARTFPAWTSVLTGKYPNQHNALFNLTPQHMVSRDTVSSHLQERGYFTVYAQDERRFNNIDESYGFDITVGPRVGAADFILPTFADHPIANNAYESILGNILFPFLTLNRASILTYSPDRFILAINSAIEDNRKPLFLATHLCLAHFPYTWSTSQTSSEYSPHEQALIGLDTQLKLLLEQLKQNKLLNNAMLVLFSDHGEQLYTEPGISSFKSNNSFYASKEHFKGQISTSHQSIIDQLFDNATGHGVNLNSRSQYNSFMIFNNFGSGGSITGLNNLPVSLASLAPSALQLSNIKPDRFGKSIFSGREVMHEQLTPVYLETGLSIAAINHPDMMNIEDVIDEAVENYQISNQGYVELKPSVIKELNKTKDTGVIWSNWMLINTFIKGNELDILVNLSTGSWSYDFSSEFARQAPVAKLQTLLTDYNQAGMLP